MQRDKLSDLDLKLKLLSGLPFEIDKAGLAYPLTLRDIARMGYGKYSQFLYLFTIDVKEFIPEDAQIEGLNAFDIIANSENNDLIQSFVDGLKLVFRVKKAKFSLHYQSVFIGEYGDNILDSSVLNRKNFDQLKDMMLYTNCLNNRRKNEYAPKDDKAKEIIEKMNRAKEKLAKVKGEKSSGDTDLSDIISAVTVKSTGINKFNVWDLTLYQLYDEYKRLDAVENYNISLQSLLHGADSNKVELKHWSSKID